MELYQKDGDFFQKIGVLDGKVYMKNVSRALLNPYANCMEDDFDKMFTATDMTMADFMRSK